VVAYLDPPVESCYMDIDNNTVEDIDS